MIDEKSEKAFLQFYDFAIIAASLVSYHHWTCSMGWYIYVITKTKSPHYSQPNWDMLLEFDHIKENILIYINL